MKTPRKRRPNLTKQILRESPGGVNVFLECSPERPTDDTFDRALDQRVESNV